MIDLHFLLQNSQVVSIKWEEQGVSLDLVSYLYKEGEEKYIGYLKPAREDLAPALKLLSFRFGLVPR